LKPILLIILLALFAGTASAETWALTPISDLVQNPERFDGRLVAIRGTVNAFMEIKSPQRLQDHQDPYDVVVLCQRSACVMADLRTRGLPFHDGATLSVGGFFTASKQMGADAMHQQVRTTCFSLAPQALSCRRTGHHVPHP
jgi:hypothetical protein